MRLIMYHARLAGGGAQAADAHDACHYLSCEVCGLRAQATDAHDACHPCLTRLSGSKARDASHYVSCEVGGWRGSGS